MTPRRGPDPTTVTLIVGALLGAALIVWHGLPPAAYLLLAAVYALLALVSQGERRGE